MITIPRCNDVQSWTSGALTACLHQILPSVCRTLRLRFALLALFWLGRPLDAWSEGALRNSVKLQGPSLMYVGSPVAAKVAHVCLLAEPAPKLDCPLDPSCSPGESQPA